MFLILFFFFWGGGSFLFLDVEMPRDSPAVFRFSNSRLVRTEAVDIPWRAWTRNCEVCNIYINKRVECIVYRARLHTR
ncbi:hypothetical protein I7I48_03770 [Histoplasma ohiense]|nr:hypothetical protein I7I48_03770 [Histoplasma ohiense (nom. inval.)]